LPIINLNVCTLSVQKKTHEKSKRLDRGKLQTNLFIHKFFHNFKEHRGISQYGKSGCHSLLHCIVKFFLHEKRFRKADVEKSDAVHGRKQYINSVIMRNDPGGKFKDYRQ
jgi:hypothetical protein